MARKKMTKEEKIFQWLMKNEFDHPDYDSKIDEYNKIVSQKVNERNQFNPYMYQKKPVKTIEVEYMLKKH